MLTIQPQKGSAVWKAIKINNKVGVDANSKDIHLQKYRDNVWGYTPFFVRIPEGLQDNDEISLFIWNIGKHDLLVNSISLQLYR